MDCGSCSLRMTSPRPTQDSVGKYYQSTDYISHSNTSKGLMNRIYHLVRHVAIRQKYALLRSLNVCNSVLDIGAGTGDLLVYLQNKGVSVKGVEPDTTARKVALEKNGLRLHDLEFLDNNEQYDIISMWHVLEHVHHPDRLLKKLALKLFPGGALVVAVPNHLSKDATIYGTDWAAYDVPRHLFHFSRNDLHALAKHSGLMVEKVLPMYFDSYYVSMLSEKARGGTFVHGMLNGFRSNISARTRTGEFSSLIYILRPNP